MTEAVSADDLRATERWFYRRGLPFLVEDYRSSTDVWTRATGFLTVVFVALVVLAALSFDDLRGAALAVAVMAVGLVAYGVANHRAGRRWYARPARVTWPVLAAFVVVPTVITLAASGEWDAAAETGIIAGAILVITWVVTRYAVIPLIGWAIRYTARGLTALYRMATRALPLMLLLITFLFISAELWQMTGGLPIARLWLLVALFVVLGIAFVIGRVPEEVRRIEASTSAEQVIAACSGTPIEGKAADLADLDRPIALSLRQRANIGLVMTVAQLVQVALFAVVVWAFFVVFGAIALSVDLQQEWLGDQADVALVWSWGDGFGVTRQLLRVSMFLGAFSGFYVTIYTAMDSTYREHFYDSIRESIERSLSVRRAYVLLRRQANDFGN